MLNNNIIESMLNQCLHNTILNTIKEGYLFTVDGTIFILYNDNEYFLTYAPYENFENNKLTKRQRIDICNLFIKEYNFEDIVKMYEEELKEKERKFKETEENVPFLENLINKYNLKKYGQTEIKINLAIIKNYIEFKRGYDYNLEIYAPVNNIYKIMYNYEPKQVTEEELQKLINDMIQSIEKDIKRDIEKQMQEAEERKHKDNKLQFAQNIASGKYVAIIKLKSSYQCLEGGLRYTIGKGSGKFYSLKGVTSIIEYLDKKEIKEYVYVSIEDIEGITIKELKQLEYKKF